MPSNTSKNFDSTGPVDACAIRFHLMSGVTIPTNSYPDEADSGIVVPLRLTSFSGLNSKPQVTSTNVMPIFNPSNSGFGIGGKTLGYGASELPKMQLEGYIDTPCTETVVSGELLNIPKPTFNSMNVTYADLIAAYTEGRAHINPALTDGGFINNMWTKINPSWFRDPFGRVYNNPKIISFSGGYVEAIPARTTFSMTLQV